MRSDDTCPQQGLHALPIATGGGAKNSLPRIPPACPNLGHQRSGRTLRGRRAGPDIRPLTPNPHSRCISRCPQTAPCPATWRANTAPHGRPGRCRYVVCHCISSHASCGCNETLQRGAPSPPRQSGFRGARISWLPAPHLKCRTGGVQNTQNRHPNTLRKQLLLN